jgi:hypothetical protein
MKSAIFILFCLVLLFSSNLFSDLKPYDGEDFDLISHRIKDDKSKSYGSGYVQSKPDPVNTLPEKLVNKGLKYIRINGLENTVSLINNKPRKFRDFNTYLFIIDLNGNVLAHSGNPNISGKNMISAKDSRGYLFIQQYIHNIQDFDGINYMNLLTLEDQTQYIHNFVYLKKIDNNLIVGAVTKP